jgi:hypothetical protein
MTNDHIPSTASQIPEALTRLIAKIEILQTEAIAKRVTFEEKRRERQFHCDAVQECDAILMKFHLSFAETDIPPDISQFRKAFVAAQDARDLFGPLEDECERLGYELAKIELLLKAKCGEFRRLSNLHAAHPGFDTTRMAAGSESDDSATVTSKSSGTSEQLHHGELESPLEYQPHIGRSDDETHDAQAEDLQIVLASSQGQQPDDHVKTQKPSFSHIIPSSAALPNFYWMDNHVDRNAVLTDSSLLNLQNSLKYIGSSNQLLKREDISAPTTMNLADLAYFEDVSLLQDQQSTHGRINRWLLHVLRSSLSEKMLFLSMFEPGVYPPSLKSEAFLEIWDDD